MPQYDLDRNTVKNALVKDGWVITDDPFVIEMYLQLLQYHRKS
jgi:hypothetical protein